MNELQREYVNNDKYPYPVKYQKVNPSAQDIILSSDSDYGFQMSLVDRTDNRIEDEVNEVNIYTTGIRISAPPGFFVEIKAVKELWKSGYMIPGGSIYIQPEDWEEIIIPLFKYREGEDIDCPFDCLEVIIHKIQYTRVKSVISLEDSNLYGVDQNHHRINVTNSHQRGGRRTNNAQNTQAVPKARKNFMM